MPTLSSGAVELIYIGMDKKLHMWDVMTSASPYNINSILAKF